METQISAGPYLIIGLGNPGAKYAATRHNVGHIVLDLLAARANRKFARAPRGNAVVTETRIGQPPSSYRVILAKSNTYMNVTGGPVAALAQYYRIPPERVIAIHDDVDLPFGTIKVKLGGGEGGHNGLRDITKALGTKDYLRVRVGVGRPPGRQDTADYVLSGFNTTERTELPDVVGAAEQATEMLITQGLVATQQRFHAPPPPPPTASS